MLRNLKGLLVLTAMAGAFVAPRAHALFVSGYPCWVSRVPKSNTSIHGNFGYVRFSVYPTSSCVTGTPSVVIELLTLGANTTGSRPDWLYSEQEIASVYEKLTDAAMNKRPLRFFYDSAVLSICGSNCRQGWYAEFGT